MGLLAGDHMDLKKTIRESELKNKDELVKLVKPGVLIDVQPIHPDEQVIGASRIGGTSDLSDEIAWPYAGQSHRIRAYPQPKGIIPAIESIPR